MARALAFGFTGVVVAQTCAAQQLPVFDVSNFEVISIEPNSKAVVRSDGRDYYCEVSVDDAAGYVLVDKCLPFVNRLEAIPAHNVAMSAEAAAVQAVAATLTESDISDILLNFAKVSSCKLSIGGEGVSNTKLIASIAAAAGIQFDFLGPEDVSLLRSRTANAVKTLAASGQVNLSKDGSTLTLKDCH